MAKLQASGMPDSFAENRRAQIYKGVLDLALLGLLKDGPEYGLQILDRLRAEAGLDLAAGSLYPLLHRLEAAGLVRATWRHESAASHQRKYYSLTSTGRQDFEDHCTAWLTMSLRLNTFLRRKLR